MDMANLNNQQQGIILKSQQDQQRILSDQKAQNAQDSLIVLVKIRLISLWQT